LIFIIPSCGNYIFRIFSVHLINFCFFCCYHIECLINLWSHNYSMYTLILAHLLLFNFIFRRNLFCTRTLVIYWREWTIIIINWSLTTNVLFLRHYLTRKEHLLSISCKIIMLKLLLSKSFNVIVRSYRYHHKIFRLNISQILLISCRMTAKNLFLITCQIILRNRVEIWKLDRLRQSLKAIINFSMIWTC
jgi:hypothetical protein